MRVCICVRVCVCMQASCWLALSALVCASGGMGAALFVPVTAVLDLALWTVQVR